MADQRRPLAQRKENQIRSQWEQSLNPGERCALTSLWSWHFIFSPEPQAERKAVRLFQQGDTVPRDCITVFHRHLSCFQPLKWAATRPISPSTPVLHNRLMPLFSSSAVCVRLQVTHPFVTLPTPLSFSFSRSLRPWSNQCRWWIIHSELCRRKLFDWQLYSRVSYIINLALLGIAAMVKAIIGQGKASGLMEWILPLQSHTLCLFLCPFSPPPCFHVSSLSLFTLVCPPEGHRSLISHRAKYNVTQVAFWSVFGWRGCSSIENRSAKTNVAKINDEVCREK